MFSISKLAIKYLRYYAGASNGRGHGIHSPFVFEFITKVLNDKQPYPAYPTIEQLRQTLSKDSRVLEIRDHGAGSVDGNHIERTVGSIARRAAKPKKYGQLLYRIAKYYAPAQTIELGTSLGITTAYLSMANEKGTVTTIEGDRSIAAVAYNNFLKLGLKNIELVNEPFDECLGNILRKRDKIDFAFIDGNHRFEATQEYFLLLLSHMGKESVIVFDDIHWSKEMERAWEVIKTHPDVLLTVDLFFIGLVFFRDSFEVKQHFLIRF